MTQNIFFENLPIWFVNLKQSEDRYIRMKESLDKYGIKNYKRIDAVDGSTHDFRITRAPYHQKDLTSGEMAANLSYIKLIREFLNSDLEYVLMCDDDVDFFNSTKMNFSFYDTLKYHKPATYSLKLNALDISYWFNESNHIETNKLIKPKSTSLGNATIINKAWAKQFLEKYDVDTDNPNPNFIYKYNKNINNIPSWIIPACDAITFDEHTYVWKVFGIFDFSSTLSPDFFNDAQKDDQRKKLFASYNKDIESYDWDKNMTINIFKEAI